MLPDIGPANRSFAVDHPGAGERDAVFEDVISHRCIGINVGQYGKAWVGLFGQLADSTWAIGADHQQGDTGVAKCLILMSQLAHLPFALWSPPATIKDEHNRLFAPILFQGDHASISRRK